MNITEIINIMLDTAAADERVHSVYNDDPYERWNQKEIMYNSVCVDFENAQSYMDYTDYNFVIYSADVLVEGQDNFTQLQTTAISVLMNILNTLDKSSEEIDVVFPVQYQPFTQSFADLLAGAYVRFSVRVNNEYICD